METKKEITINELAGMMQRGFVALESKMDEKFDIVDKRFEQVDKRFEQVDKRFEQVDKRFEEVDKKFEKVDERFNAVLTNQDHILERLENLEMDNTAGAMAYRRQDDKLENHEKRIVVAEKKLGIGAAI